jgi:hypothetical protein
MIVLQSVGLGPGKGKTKKAAALGGNVKLEERKGSKNDERRSSRRELGGARRGRTQAGLAKEMDAVVMAPVARASSPSPHHFT